MSKKAPTTFEQMTDSEIAKELDEAKYCARLINRTMQLIRREQKRRQKERRATNEQD